MRIFHIAVFPKFQRDTMTELEEWFHRECGHPSRSERDTFTYLVWFGGLAEFRSKADASVFVEQLEHAHVQLAVEYNICSAPRIAANAGASA